MFKYYTFLFFLISLSAKAQTTTEQDVFLCYGESVIVGESEYDEPGTYTDVLTAEDGSDSTVITTVEVSDEINTNVVVDGATLEAVASGMGYQWMECEPFELILGAETQTYVAEENGDYAVIITNGDGCVDTSECYTISTVGLQDEDTPTEFSIYPNPTQGNVFINGIQLENAQLSIYSISGQMIHQQIIRNETTTVNLSNYEQGIYFIEIVKNNRKSTQKLVVK